MRYYEDPILGKGRAADISGGTGGSGTTYIGGFAIGIAGETISRLRYMPIESVTGNSVTLQAGHAYKAYATSTAITLNTETVPDGQFGLEGHIEIYVAGTGYVMTGTNVVLANALEPDSVNNCTLRFHDGVCIISVEDHVAGYIVVNGSTSGTGSLYYGISTSTNDYVAFDASLNGTTIPLAGATAEGEKHVVGNGYPETAITGAVNCGTSKFTVANLGLQNVQVMGGTMTLGDAFIPSGSTVAVSGGGLAVEKVSGNGGVIDLGGSQNILATNATMNASGVVFTGGATGGSPIIVGSNAVAGFTGCVFSGLSAPDRGIIRTLNSANATLVNCLVEDNSAPSFGNCALVLSGSVLNVSGSTIGVAQDIQLGAASVVCKGENKMLANITAHFSDTGHTGTVTLTSGAILDLTGNTNATPIAPGGGITFASGGATVYPSAGQASAYMLGGMTVPTIGNTNVVNLGGSSHINVINQQVLVSGATVANGSGSYYGGCFELTNNASGSCHAVLSNTLVTGGTATTGAGLAATGNNTTVEISGCTFANNSRVGGGANAGGMFVGYGAQATIIDTVFESNIGYGLTGGLVTLSGCTFGSGQDIQVATPGITLAGINTINAIDGAGAVTISSGASINLAGSIAPGGGITVLTGGCTVNGNAIPAGTYTSIDSTGTPT